MFRKLVIIGIILGLAGSASAIKYVGNPNAGNGWDTTSAVTAKDPISEGLVNFYQNWTQSPGPWVVVDGNGINPANKDQHSTAEYPGTFADANTEWDACRNIQNSTGGNAVAYDTDMNASGKMWFAFDFNTVHYIADMEVWNYNAYPGDCLPVGTQSPCQWTTKPDYSMRDWRISYSTDKAVWKETIKGSLAKGTELTQGPQEGWNWGDDNQYPDIITIDANAKYVVITGIPYQNNGTGIRVGIGEARFETDPNRATNPYRNGGDKFMNMSLSWRPGDDATIAKHKVYLSADPCAVAGRSAPNTVVTTSTYDWPGLVPGPVGSGTQYYWAVDELNASNVVVGEGTGRLWEFTEINLGLVDDYESYDSSSNYIFNTWDDGWTSSGNYDNGALVNIAYFPYGLQGMEIMYDNDGWWNNSSPYRAVSVYYSEVRVETDNLIGSCRDLTNGGVTTWIKTWVMGPNTNDVNEQLYIKLEDGDGNTAQVQYLPIAELKDDTWHEWHIALSDFTGVDLTDVNAISFVIGDGIDPCSPNPNGGTVGNGVIYFDDFRLQPPECGIEGETDPTLAQGDLNDDCIIDWKDLAILVNNWLDTGAAP